MNWNTIVIMNNGENIKTTEELLYGEHGITIYMSKCYHVFIPYTSIVKITASGD